MRTRSPGFRQAARVFVTAAVAMTLAAALHLPHGQWLTITAALGLRATYDETVTHLIQRVGGTVLGSVIAAVLLALAPGHLTAAAVLFGFACAAFALRSVNFGYWMLFGTPVALMLLDFSTPSDWTAAGERIGLVVAGGALAFAATRLLWPTGHAERLPAQLRRLLTVHADLVRATAAVVEGDLERLPRDKVVAAEQSVEAVTDARTHLQNERVPDAERIDRLTEVISAARRVRDHLVAVTRMTRRDAEDTGPVPQILDRVADHLEEIDDRLTDAEAADLPPLRERLDEDFADLDAHLARLAKRRRAEIRGGVGTDEQTPVRHAVLQISGSRHALRSLRRDVDDLVAGCLAAARPS
ncbi:MAG: FUSC family protein [Actinomadura rubrobrunea]|nr:FUSC family protein [Actinomadura rubrobrunea]